MITKKVTYVNEEGFEFKFDLCEHSLKIVKTETGYTAKYIINDDNPDDPRNWDNLGTMICFHNRYTLGDNEQKRNNKYLVTVNKEDFTSWEELQDYLIKQEKAVIVLPLYLYDHSGISIKVGSFQGLLPQGHAEFDSGQVGFVYITKEKLKKEGMTKKQAEKSILTEIETYNQYLTGDTYILVKETYNKNKQRIDYDTLGGFFGYEDSLKALETEI